MTFIKPWRKIWATLLSNFEETHAGLERQRISRVIRWKWCVLWPPEEQQETLKFLELPSLFPRVRLITAININILKIICNSNEFSDFERRTEKRRIVLRLLSHNNVTKWEGQQKVNFELRKHLWGVADIGAIVEIQTRTQIYSRNCLSFFEFPCFLALGNKQTNKTTFWTICCTIEEELIVIDVFVNRIYDAINEISIVCLTLKSPSILLRLPNFDCYLLVFVKRCGQVIISVAW